MDANLLVAVIYFDDEERTARRFDESVSLAGRREMKDPFIWRRVDQRAVLRAWAIAEATSAKKPLEQAVMQARGPTGLSAKILAGRHAKITETEWQWLEQSILEVRRALLHGLIRLRPDWYEGEVPIIFLEDMRFFKLSDWVRKVPSRQFADLVMSRERPAGNEPEFRGFATSIERPIAAGPSLDGPFCLLEGYTRCGCLLRDYRAGFSSLDRLPMMIGVTPRIAEWSDGHGHLWW